MSLDERGRPHRAAIRMYHPIGVAVDESARTIVPYLEHHLAAGAPAQRTLLHRLPFRIGRSQEADLTVYSREVSTLHAEIARAGDGFVIRDLGSTNGTFVNGERTEQSWLRAGDIVHVAHEELRFGLAERSGAAQAEATLASRESRQQQLIRETNDLSRVLARRAVSAVFQPIVLLEGGARIGYETLGRVALPELPYSIGALLRIAVERGQGARLSRMMREVALEELPHIPERPTTVFFNLHPAEMSEPEQLAEAFSAIASALGPEQHAMLEVHESAVTDPAAMARIREALSAMNIGLAYDDFGAGQSRLMELVEVPPDVIKLDMTLVRDVDANAKRQDLLRALVRVMRDMGIRVLAEGIERAEEAAVCRELGCELGQGYFFGRPEPLARP